MARTKVTQKKVLLVDDNKVFQDSLAGLLRNEDIEALTAELGTTDYLIKDQWEAERIIAYIKGLLHA